MDTNTNHLQTAETPVRTPNLRASLKKNRTVVFAEFSRNSLPVIDISKLQSSNNRLRKHEAQRVAEVAMQNGFLYLNNHGVTDTLIDAVYNQSRSFFDLELNAKQRYYIGNSKNHRGYVPVAEKGDYEDEQGPRRYEAFDMGMDLANATRAAQQLPLVGKNVWPEIPGFKDVLTAYLTEMQRLTAILCQTFESILDLQPGYFLRHMKSPMSQLRLLHYFEQNRLQRAGTVNMGAHTDYEMFTILHSRTDGLQILDLNSNWIDAPPIPGTFYFNIGDMLEAWSGGLFVATPHRVANDEERYSLPFFAATDFDTCVQSVRCERYASRQRDYAPIHAGRHLVSNLLRDFPYLKRRQENGQLKIDGVTRHDNPFEARMRAANGGKPIAVANL